MRGDRQRQRPELVGGAWRHAGRITATVAVLVAAVVALSACGGETASTTLSTGPTSTSTPDVASTTIPGTQPSSTSSTAVTSSTTHTSEDCSAALLAQELGPQPDLPEAVAETREAIFTAASSCDYDGLEELAAGGGADFTFSFGDPGEGPATYWRSAEERGEAVMAWLATVLTMPYGRVAHQYVWPFAHALDFSALTSDEEQLLADHFPANEIGDWKAAGSYMGYRVGVSAEGEWLYFVAGD